MRKICLFFALVLALSGLASCDKPNPAGGPAESGVYGSSAPEVSSAPAFAVNPLTGEENLTPGQEKIRPVAIMVNNIKTAWSVQTGLGSADIVYETLVEGGITRLMAVFQNIAAAPTVGTIRSARYSYAELALALDAVYVSMGSDTKYYNPYQKQLGLEWYNLMSHESASFRVQNGKAYEHTLYTSGEKLSAGLNKAGVRMTARDSGKSPIFDFRPSDAPEKLPGGVCNSVNVTFSDTYSSSYSYDAAAAVYLKSQGGVSHADYKTGAQLRVKNVFILFAKVTEFPDAYHVKSHLTSGDGYYISEGTFQQISWSKGEAKNPFAFTDQNGAPLKVNAGKSWISIADEAHRGTFSIKE